MVVMLAHELRMGSAHSLISMQSGYSVPATSTSSCLNPSGQLQVKFVMGTPNSRGSGYTDEQVRLKPGGEMLRQYAMFVELQTSKAAQQAREGGLRDKEENEKSAWH